jgi:esterase FrsA
MPYTYPIDARALFEDRAHQFVGFGLPADDVARVRAATTDFWTNGPGGWVYQWSALAAEYTAKGAPLLAALAYGCAKFPCLADDARKTARRTVNGPGTTQTARCSDASAAVWLWLVCSMAYRTVR